MNKICFCIPTTTKNRPDDNKTPELITSLTQLDDSIVGENNKLTIYVGYDSDDPFYTEDFNKNQFLLLTNLNVIWLEQEVEKGNVVEIWNNLAKRAMNDGYDYFMIIGDDIDYPRNYSWIDSVLTAKLKSTNDIGIAGGDSGNPNLPMTQFMISRKHLQFFGYVYNPMLKNWFCDNYLLELYPKKFTHYMSEIKLTNTGGQPRYRPENHQRLYKALVKRDRPKLLKYINNNNYMD